MLVMRNHAQSGVEDGSGHQNYGFMWNMKSGNPDSRGFITVSFHCFYLMHALIARSACLRRLHAPQAWF